MKMKTILGVVFAILFWSQTLLALPDFIPTVRTTGSEAQEAFETKAVRELGLPYVQGLVDLSWINIVRPNPAGGPPILKWGHTDAQMDALAKSGLKVIAFVITPKLEGLHWDPSIKRNDPRYAAAYGSFAYEIVNRYHNHPAWSGLICVWGGSSDVWGEHPFGEPEVNVPLLNAAYDGVKRADPKTIVISFNMATTFTTPEDWEQWHQRAFALSPKFDWFGVQSHQAYPTYLVSSNKYGGVLGLLNVRKFLDANGYTAKPIWLNEGGILMDQVPSESAQAEQVAELFIVSRTLAVNLKGWVYFGSVSFEGEPEDFGLMKAANKETNPQPRKAWQALQTLVRTVRFSDYRFESKLSGDYNQPSPFVYRFVRPDRPGSRLWVVFSPRLPKQEPLTQEVTISIAPATSAVLIDMLGGQRMVQADAAGNVRLVAVSSPVYLKTE